MAQKKIKKKQEEEEHNLAVSEKYRKAREALGLTKKEPAKKVETIQKEQDKEQQIRAEELKKQSEMNDKQSKTFENIAAATIANMKATDKPSLVERIRDRREKRRMRAGT